MKIKLKKSFLEVKKGTRYVGIHTDEWQYFLRSLRRARAILTYLKGCKLAREVKRRYQYNNDYRLIKEHEYFKVQRMLSSPLTKDVIEKTDVRGFLHAIRDRDTQKPPRQRDLAEMFGVSDSMISQVVSGKRPVPETMVRKFYELYPDVAPKFFVDPDVPQIIDIESFFEVIDDTPYAVAKKLCISKQTVYSWVNHGSMPKPAQLRKLAYVYGPVAREALLPFLYNNDDKEEE